MSTVKTMRVNKWGNSLGIRFPSEFVDLVRLEEKSLVDIKVEGQQIIITKREGAPPRKTIQELFALYPADYIEDSEVDWGKPVGGELW